MKNLFNAIYLVFLSSIFTAQTPYFVWAKPLGDAVDDRGVSVKVDASGNVFTLGYFEGVVDFDPGPGTFTLNSLGLTKVFITKFDGAGNFIWVKAFAGNVSNDYSTSLALDASGNIYSTGYFEGTADFDPGVGTFTLTPNGFADVFISKLDVNGNFMWAKKLGGNSNDYGHSVTVDPSGNVYTTGSFGSTIVDFDPGVGTFTLGANGSSDIFISKLDASGNFVWAKKIGGTSSEEAYGIALDASNNVYTTGYFSSSTADFDPGVGVFNLSAVSGDVFVSKLDVNGNFVWAKKWGGLSFDIGQSITIDGTGNVYTCGAYNGLVNFNPSATFTMVSNGGSDDVFISKLDASGNFLWAKSIGSSTHNDLAYTIGVDAINNLYIGGYFGGTTDFDPGAGVVNSISNGNTDVFVLKLDPLGNYSWVTTWGGIAYDELLSLNINSSGEVLSTGVYKDVVDFDFGSGTFTISSNGGSEDCFIHKIGICNPPIAPVITTSLSNLLICTPNNTTTINASATGTINWYSSPTSTLSLGTGTAFATPTLAIGTYTYYAEATTCTTSISRTAITVSVSVCTGITENNKLNTINISIYPNPSNGVFEMNLKEIGDLTLIEATGRTVLKQKVTIGKNSIDISSYANGIYFLQILNNGKIISVHKIVKQ